MCTLSLLPAEYLAAEDFPEHIKSLVLKEKESEEQEKRQREIERNTCKVHGSCQIGSWSVVFLQNEDQSTSCLSCKTTSTIIVLLLFTSR